MSRRKTRGVKPNMERYKMRRAILLSGFNNWGKTTHIQSLFGRSNFYKGYLFGVPNVNASFTVESHSNDDLLEVRFVNVVTNKIAASPDGGANIFCAFCLSREPNNDSRRILTSAPFATYDKIHVILLQYKWDFHAELRIQDITNYLSPIPHVMLFTVNADRNLTIDTQRASARETQIIWFSSPNNLPLMTITLFRVFASTHDASVALP